MGPATIGHSDVTMFLTAAMVLMKQTAVRRVEIYKQKQYVAVK